MSIRTPGFVLRDDQDGAAGDIAVPAHLRHGKSVHRKGQRKTARKRSRK